MVTFKDKKNQQLIVEKKIVDDTVVLKDCTNCIIEQLDISHNGSNKNKTSDLKMVQLVDCRDCKIIDSKLHGKETLGVILNIVGSKTSGNIVERCKFFDLTFSGENGGEPIRLGTSQHGNIDMHNTVRNCDFIKLRTKEPEAISIKSVNKLIEKNRMQDCTCSFVVRHGFGNTIQDNIFEGEGGIRVYGKDNKILRNHHKNNVSSKFPPLSLVNGNKEEEDLSAQYTQVRNNIVEGNIYEECKYAVIWGRDDTKKRSQKVSSLSKTR